MKSEKLKTRLCTPIWVNILGILLGGVLIVIGYSIRFFVASEITGGFYGAGGSFIVGVILNIIFEYKTGDLLTETVMKGIFEIPESARYIRYGQSIRFIVKELFEHEGETYLKLDCVHSYKLRNESTSVKKISINTFNDLNISKELNERLLPKHKTQFKEIKITHFPSGETENFSPKNHEHRNKFYGPDEYGRPCFIAKDIRIDAKSGDSFGWMEISYRISNAHYLKSRHSWYFQELSDGLELIIENETKYPNSCFSVIFNHPNREEIESCNIDSINTAGQLKGGEQYSSIKTNFVFLPYQGFFLQWDLEEYAKSSKKEQEIGAGLINNVT